MEPRMNGDGVLEWRDGEGRLHRDGAPARVYVNGTEEWYRHGKRHRDPDEGPAASYPDGRRIWFVDGVKVRSERGR
jgi:hypothetical protein